MMYLAINTSLLNPLAEGVMTELNDYGSLDYDDFNQKVLRHFFDDEYDSEDNPKGRVFYSHSIMIYGTASERYEKELIRHSFKDFGIISPKFYDVNREKFGEVTADFYKREHQRKMDKMEFYKAIVSSCQMLVYSKWKNETTSGVVIEVNHAIDIGIPVFELVGNKFVPQSDHIDGLSYEETLEKYEKDSASK